MSLGDCISDSGGLVATDGRLFADLVTGGSSTDARRDIWRARARSLV